MCTVLLNEDVYGTIFKFTTQVDGPIRQPGSIVKPSVLPMPIIQSMQLHFGWMYHLLNNNLKRREKAREDDWSFCIPCMFYTNIHQLPSLQVSQNYRACL